MPLSAVNNNIHTYNVHVFIVIIFLVETNMTCHPQCSSSFGWCWGPNDTQCVTCTNFIFDGQCVPTCDDFDAHGV